MLAYDQMTQEQRDEYNALVARLDDLLVKKSRERRQQVAPIDFQERRIADRRKFPR